MADSDRKKIKDQQKGTFKTAAGLTDVTSAVNECHQETFVFDVPADAAVAEIGISMPAAGKVVAVQGLAVTGLAVSGSAYIAQTIKKRDGVGGAAVTVASFDTNTAGQNKAITAWVPYDFTLTSTNADRFFSKGNVLTFTSAETSTPVTPIAKVRVTVEYGAL